MAVFQDVLQLLHPATNSVKTLDDVCGDGPVPVEGNNFEEEDPFPSNVG